MPQGPTRFVLTGGGRTFSLATGAYVVGRGSEADIQFDLDRKLSRKNTRLVVEEDSVQIEDLGSSNGTWVNGTQVRKVTRIGARTAPVVGDTELVLEPASSQDWLRATIPEGRFERSVYADEVTTSKRAAGFESLREAVGGLIDEGMIVDAQRMLDPILDTLLRTQAAPGPDMIDVCCELALRLARALASSGYVDTALRIQTRHGSPLVDGNLSLFLECVAARLLPGSDTIASYLNLLRQREDLAEQLTLLERVLRDDHAVA
jgi:hypothetical protein